MGYIIHGNTPYAILTVKQTNLPEDIQQFIIHATNINEKNFGNKIQVNSFHSLIHNCTGYLPAKRKKIE